MPTEQSAAPKQKKPKAPDAASTAHPDFDDEIARILAERIAAVKNIPNDDPSAAVLRPLCNNVLASAEDLRREAWVWRTETDKMFDAARFMIDQEIQSAEARAEVPLFATSIDVRTARYGIRMQAEEKAQRASRDQFAQMRGDEAAKVIAEFFADWTALGDAAQKEYAGYMGPSSLYGSPLSIEDLQLEETVTQELEAQKNPIENATLTLERLSTPPIDDKRLAIFVRASRRLAIRIRDMNPNQLLHRFRNNGTYDAGAAIMSPQGQALKYLERLDDLKAANVPTGINCAANTIHIMRHVCHELVGTSPPRVWDFENKLRKKPLPMADGGPDWDFDAKRWPARFCAPTTLALPGYSKQIATSGYGVPIRASKGG